MSLSSSMESFWKNIGKNYSSLRSGLVPKQSGTVREVRSWITGAVWALLALGGAAWATLYAQVAPDSAINNASSKFLHLVWKQDTALDQFNASQKNLQMSRADNGALQLSVAHAKTSEALMKSELDSLKKEMNAIKMSLKEMDTKLLHQGWKIEKLTTHVRHQKTTTVSASAKKTTSVKVTPKKRAHSLKSAKIRKTMIISEKRSPISHEELTILTKNAQNQLNQPGMEIHTKVCQWGRYKVWVSYKGHISSGFFTTTAKHQSRLTPDGMKAWAKNRMKFLSKFDTIEQVAKKQSILLKKSSQTQYLKISETREGKIRFLLKTPKKDDIDFTVPLRDISVKKFSAILKSIQKRSNEQAEKTDTPKTVSNPKVVAPKQDTTKDTNKKIQTPKGTVIEKKSVTPKLSTPEKKEEPTSSLPQKWATLSTPEIQPPINKKESKTDLTNIKEELDLFEKSLIDGKINFTQKNLDQERTLLVQSMATPEDKKTIAELQEQLDRIERSYKACTYTPYGKQIGEELSDDALSSFTTNNPSYTPPTSPMNWAMNTHIIDWMPRKP